MLGGADNPNGELPSYITGADTSRSCNIIFQSNEKPFIHVIPTITSLLTIPPTMFCDGTLPPFRYLPASTGTRILSNKSANL